MKLFKVQTIYVNYFWCRLHLSSPDHALIINEDASLRTFLKNLFLSIFYDIKIRNEKKKLFISFFLLIFF